MTKKYTSFSDIPQLIQAGSYGIDVPLHRVLHQVADWQTAWQFDLDPDFQRPHCWTEAQQRRYLEFLLRGGKTATTIYFNKPSWHRVLDAVAYDDGVLVDGKQRLEAVRKFYADELKVFGSYHREFTDKAHKAWLRFNVNDLRTRAEVLQWYLDFNTGGTVHTDDEIERVRELLAKEQK